MLNGIAYSNICSNYIEEFQLCGAVLRVDVTFGNDTKAYKLKSTRRDKPLLDNTREIVHIYSRVLAMVAGEVHTLEVVSSSLTPGSIR